MEVSRQTRVLSLESDCHRLELHRQLLPNQNQLLRKQKRLQTTLDNSNNQRQKARCTYTQDSVQSGCGKHRETHNKTLQAVSSNGVVETGVYR